MQFAAHIGPRRMLLAMAAAALVEASPHDHFWGLCVDGSGTNHLGLLLLRLRKELEMVGPWPICREPGAPGGWDTSA